MRKITVGFLLTLMIWGCNKKDDNQPIDDDVDIIPIKYSIPVGSTFEWRLDALPNNFTTSADVVDIDAFGATPELIANLKAQGKTVIAYISVGSVENYRSDANQFPEEVIGNVYEGYENENWLDISNIDALSSILKARFDMVKAKGFDGIEPDNIDGYQNNSGFSLNKADALAFCRWLIKEAHDRELSIGQKNAPELIPELVDEFDWMLTESAIKQGWHTSTVPYITQNKAVFTTEYDDVTTLDQFKNNACTIANQNNFSALYKHRILNNVAIYCD